LRYGVADQVADDLAYPLVVGVDDHGIRRVQRDRPAGVHDAGLADGLGRDAREVDGLASAMKRRILSSERSASNSRIVVSSSTTSSR
jgi:hypothetical protein